MCENGFLFLSLTVKYVDYGLDRPWFKSLQGLENNVKTALKPTLSHTECVPWARRPGREVDHSPTYNAELSISGTISTS